MASGSEGAGLEAGQAGPDNGAADTDSGEDSEGRELDPDSSDELESPLRMDIVLADWTKEALCRALMERVDRSV